MREVIGACLVTKKTIPIMMKIAPIIIIKVYTIIYNCPSVTLTRYFGSILIGFVRFLIRMG